MVTRSLRRPLTFMQGVFSVSALPNDLQVFIVGKTGLQDVYRNSALHQDTSAHYTGDSFSITAFTFGIFSLI